MLFNRFYARNGFRDDKPASWSKDDWQGSENPSLLPQLNTCSSYAALDVQYLDFQIPSSPVRESELALRGRELQLVSSTKASQPLTLCRSGSDAAGGVFIPGRKDRGQSKENNRRVNFLAPLTVRNSQSGALSMLVEPACA